MSKVAVVYWSGTGNTEIMAKAVAEGIEATGSIATLFTASEFNGSLIDEFDAVAFGCPSMGAEELEEYEFLPMFELVKGKLEDKNVALFGSYDWGDGEWMETWEEEVRSLGANLINEGLITHLTPEVEDLDKCKRLGETLAKA